MGLIADKLLALTNQLFPSGRAFWVKVNSDKEKLIKGFVASEERFYNDSVSLLDSALPDNTNFTTDDAASWERRLGLITNTLVPLADRKLAIQRKMNHPGSIAARQHYLYLQGQLQAAGFNVYVYENRFPYGDGTYYTKTPDQFSLLPFPTKAVQLADAQLGSFQLGGSYGNKIANSLNESGDYAFDLGNNLRFTFFIGGITSGSWATVDVNRKDEFRKLVLGIKPVQTIAFTLINFY